MRSVERPNFLEQEDSDATSLSLTDLGAQLCEKRFNITPWGRLHWLDEKKSGRECADAFASWVDSTTIKY